MGCRARPGRWARWRVCRWRRCCCSRSPPLRWAYSLFTGQDTFRSAAPGTQVLLLLAGPVTAAVPLLFFAAGARRIPLSLLGLLQYTGPTLQLLLGIWLWHEPFPAQKQIGYALIWVSLLIYALEGVWVSRRNAVKSISATNEA